MSKKVRISAVSYTNSLPFIYGMEHSGLLAEVDMSRDIPSACADKLIHKQADLGIVPVAALLDIPGYQIVSNYCIGADGAVDSVFIFSEKPVEQIRSLRLDSHSRTSNGLARLLLKEYWKRTDVEILPADVRPEVQTDGFVQIGDRTFGQRAVHSHTYDLAEYWKKHTGLPFVFAVWAAVSPLSETFVSKLNEAIALGLDHRNEVISDLPVIPNFDYKQYLNFNLDYRLDERKKEAMRRYLAWMSDENNKLSSYDGHQ